MIERIGLGCRLSGDDSIEFYRILHNPTKEEIDVANSHFNEIEKKIHIEQLDNGDYIAKIQYPFYEYVCGVTGLTCCGCSLFCEHRREK